MQHILWTIAFMQHTLWIIAFMLHTLWTIAYMQNTLQIFAVTQTLLLNDNCFYANTFMDHTETYALFTLLRGLA